MRHVLAALVLVLPLHALWASWSTAFDQETLDAARVLAGLERTNIPIMLATAPPASGSRRVEAWTSYHPDGKGQQIFLYAGSDMFRCARWPFRLRQCRIRLASVLVHEAWHWEHGRDEGDAYEAQIAFLMRNGAATEHVKAVRLARNQVLSEQRRASPDARPRSGAKDNTR